MITSSILNSMMGKEISTLPSSDGTMHIDRKQGNYMIMPYAQPFDKDDVVTLQFSSDTITLPTLKFYIYDSLVEIEEITGTLVSTRDGDAGTRYYFNYEVTLDSDYYDKCVYYILTQGSDTIKGEPVHILDLTEDINDGTCRIIHYTNFDRVESDLDGRFIDWENIGTVDNLLYIYQYSIDRELSDNDEIELISGSENYEVASASLFTGVKLQTNPVPDYRVRQLSAITSVDFWSINEVEYVKESAVEYELFGDTTSFECVISATKKNSIGINVDNIGYVTSAETTDMIIPTVRSGEIADFNIEIPDGYMLHTILCRHAVTSTGSDATIIAGLTFGGTDYISALGGIVEDGYTFSSSPHDRPSFTAASTLYIGISGTGVVLDFVINFDKAS